MSYIDIPHRAVCMVIYRPNELIWIVVLTLPKPKTRKLSIERATETEAQDLKLGEDVA